MVKFHARMCSLKSKNVRFSTSLRITNARKFSCRSTTFYSSYSNDDIVFIPVLVVVIPMLVVLIPNRLCSVYSSSVQFLFMEPIEFYYVLCIMNWLYTILYGKKTSSNIQDRMKGKYTAMLFLIFIQGSEETKFITVFWIVP